MVCLMSCIFFPPVLYMEGASPVLTEWAPCVSAAMPLSRLHFFFTSPSSAFFFSQYHRQVQKSLSHVQVSHFGMYFFIPHFFPVRDVALSMSCLPLMPPQPKKQAKTRRRVASSPALAANHSSTARVCMKQQPPTTTTRCNSGPSPAPRPCLQVHSTI